MSPSAALHDPVFRAYVGLVLGVLVVAGLVLALLRFVWRAKLGSVWATYRSWLWMTPLAALFIFAGRIPFILGVSALGLLAAREFVGRSDSKIDRWTSMSVYAGIAAVGMAAIVETGFVALPGLVLGLLMLVPIIRNRVGGAFRGVSLGLLAFFCTGWMFGHLGLLANSGNAYGYICFLLFATEVTDVAAFTFGKMLGRHPLRSEISPRKTWEGACGALLVAMILPWLLHFSFPFFGGRELLLTGLIVGLGGQLGDLAFSVLKRDLGVKDWSEAIPGHGGVLDRIDSLIFVAPLFLVLTTHYNPGR
ncbi:MAG: phosphatidate cytidylyltransferase [Chthoniobacterales bacterium]